MGLETAVTIDQLVETWPLQSDKIRQGAGHLRNFKKAVKTTWPNINAPVTKTAAALNAMPDNFAAVLAELLKHVVPMGGIIEWSGSIANIPAEWALCNGQTVAGFGVVPNLTDRFIVGAGNSYNVGTTGGSISKTSELGGGHTPVIQGTSLTAAQNGPHTHVGATATGSNRDNGDPGSLIVTAPDESNGTQSFGSFTTANSGSGSPHTHIADAVPDHQHNISDIRPPYYALAYIIKITAYVPPA